VAGLRPESLSAAEISETDRGTLTILTTRNTTYEVRDGICIAVIHSSGVRQSSNEALHRRLAGFVDETGDIRSMAKEPEIGRRVVFACPNDYLITSPIVTVARRLPHGEPRP